MLIAIHIWNPGYFLTMNFRAKLFSPASNSQQPCRLEVKCNSSYSHCQLANHINLMKPIHDKAASIFLKITSNLGKKFSLLLYNAFLKPRDNTIEIEANQGTCHPEFCLWILGDSVLTHLAVHQTQGWPLHTIMHNVPQPRRWTEANVGHFCRQERVLTAIEIKQGKK